MHKRALSSPRALRCSLRNRLKKLEGDASDKGVTRAEARAEVLDNDTGERLDDEEAGVRLKNGGFFKIPS